MQTMGIDIGGSKIRAVLWDGKKVLKVQQVKTPKKLAEFQNVIFKLFAPIDALGASIGIGAAGAISGTKIIFSPNIKYLKSFDFKSLGGFTAKLKLDNDARCFARAEIGSADGKFLKKNSVLFLTLGTGIGRALAKNGKVLKIKKFEYPEKWEKEYQKARGIPKNNMSDELADFLAEKLMPIVKKYNADRIVFGGGVTERGGFLRQMQKAFRRYGWNGNILMSKYGKNAVAIGAAMLLK